MRLEQELGSNVQEASTSSTGKFEVAAPEMGSYVLRVQKRGYADYVEQLQVSESELGVFNVVLLRTGERQSGAEVQFSDRPDFTVAGVTDWTAAGGHGSDVALRTSEALAKETTTLKDKGTAAGKQAADPDALRKKRDQLQATLTGADHADLHRQLGDIDEQLNEPLAAEHEYERAVQIDPTEQNYFAWGTELLLHRAIQPAREVYVKGAMAYPQSERMLAGLGAALYASGMYAQAAERLCAASDLNPSDATPYLFLGKMVQASQQALPCAEEKLARFSHDRPDAAASNYYYALALWKQAAEDHRTLVQDRVESLLKKSIQADPKFTEAYLQLGILYSERGEGQRAISAYQQAANSDPHLAEAHFRLAQTYKKEGSAGKARQEFEAYQRIVKSDAAAIEQQRREIQQFVVVFKDQPQSSAEQP